MNYFSGSKLTYDGAVVNVLKNDFLVLLFILFDMQSIFFRVMSVQYCNYCLKILKLILHLKNIKHIYITYKNQSFFRFIPKFIW